MSVKSKKPIKQQIQDVCPRLDSLFNFRVQCRWIRAASFTLLTFAVLTVQASDLDKIVNFDIDAQPLDSALIEFSEQSNVQLMVATELVAGLESPGIKGNFATADALIALIGANELTFQEAGENTIAVSQPNGDSQPAEGKTEPPVLPDAMDTVADNSDETAADTGKQSTFIADNRLDFTEEIVVTGVRGKPRSVADSPSPVDVISSVALEQTGRPGVFQAIQYLVPSFHLPSRAGGSTSTVIATGGLRGLNPDQTLILINGKRRHTTALINAVSSLYNGSVPADLDHIPVSAIDRVEVLRDGAAAQYGSDAIAGVINIILKDDTEGGAIRLTAGQNIDRDDGELKQVAGSVGFRLGDSGFAHFSMEAKDQNASNRALPIDPGVQLYYPLPNGLPDPREASINRLVTENYGVMPTESITLGYNLGWALANAVELYSFGTYSDRDTTLNWSFREPNDPNNIDSVYPDGFHPRLMIAETDFEVAFGARGAIGEWQWDVTSIFGQNKADRDASETINASLGPASPTEFYVGQLKSADWVNTLDLTRAYAAGEGEFQLSWGAQHHREYYEVSVGDPASYAAGNFVFPIGHPREGQMPAPAAQANHGITPDDASDLKRDSFAFYGELGWSPSDDLFLGIAARYEDYDDAAGDSLVGKLTGRYAISDRLALRATASSGFRAPPLAQQQYASTTSQFRDLDGDGALELLLIKQLPPESPAAIALGAVPLVPEESLNISAGFAWEPLDSLTVTVDAYRIELDDRISITSTLSGPEVTAILVANGLSDSLSGQYYTNAIDTTTTGVDIVASYAVDAGSAGSFAFNFGFNSNDTDIDYIAPNPPELAALGPQFVLFDRSRQGNLTYGFPEYKGVFGINWQWRKLSTNARIVQFGPYRTTDNNPANERNVDSEAIVDLDITYQFTDLLSVTMGAINLFNTYPTQIQPPSTVRGANHYDTRGGFSFTGGAYYARFELTF